jgi:hypothetical protein
MSEAVQEKLQTLRNEAASPPCKPAYLAIAQLAESGEGLDSPTDAGGVLLLDVPGVGWAVNHLIGLGCVALTIGSRGNVLTLPRKRTLRQSDHLGVAVSTVTYAVLAHLHGCDRHRGIPELEVGKACKEPLDLERHRGSLCVFVPEPGSSGVMPGRFRARQEWGTLCSLLSVQTGKSWCDESSSEDSESAHEESESEESSESESQESSAPKDESGEGDVEEVSSDSHSDEDDSASESDDDSDDDEHPAKKVKVADVLQ